MGGGVGFGGVVASAGLDRGAFTGGTTAEETPSSPEFGGFMTAEGIRSPDDPPEFDGELMIVFPLPLALLLGGEGRVAIEWLGAATVADSQHMDIEAEVVTRPVSTRYVVGWI